VWWKARILRVRVGVVTSLSLHEDVEIQDIAFGMFVLGSILIGSTF
jgi:hypothetical protein